MGDKIICPLLTTSTVVKEDGTIQIGTQPVYCIEDQCGWYLEERRKCAIKALGGKK